MLRKYLRKIVNREGRNSPYLGHYLQEMQFATLPQVEEPHDPFDDDSEIYLEDIDFENCDIISIDFNTNVMKVWAGGDWQEPLEFSLVFNADEEQWYYANDAIQIPEANTDEQEEAQQADPGVQELIKIINELYP